MDNITAAEELLTFLDPEKLKFEGREQDAPEELRQKVRFVEDLDLAIEHYDSDQGFQALMDEVDHLDSKALAVIWKDSTLKERRREIEDLFLAFPPVILPIDEVTGAMLNVGDNVQYLLIAITDYRLAFGKSSELLERCVQLLDLGFLPIGYDEERDLLYAYSRPLS